MYREWLGDKVLDYCSFHTPSCIIPIRPAVHRCKTVIASLGLLNVLRVFRILRMRRLKRTVSDLALSVMFGVRSLARRACYDHGMEGMHCRHLSHAALCVGGWPVSLPNNSKNIISKECKRIKTHATEFVASSDHRLNSMCDEVCHYSMAEILANRSTSRLLRKSALDIIYSLEG